ncbi:MAG: four helix bundle protein [Cyanothece sp. SIO1E1]|nr:four helix bundle protein [Cyanothece sp. SIO1E1]
MEKPHRKLNVWQRSVDFTTHIYQITAKFPTTEKSGLAVQMRQSAASIPIVLAEGASSNPGEFIQCLSKALSLANELDTQLEICRRLDYIATEMHQTLDKELTQIIRLLFGLGRSLAKRQSESATKAPPAYGATTSTRR